MTTETKSFRFMQLSDLHFSNGYLELETNHKHSIEMLQGIVKVAADKLEGLDRLIVSGDLSNYGDSQSLTLAHAWLTREIPLGQGKFSGLKFPEHLMRAVPGNHDAWNSPTAGKFVDRRQKSVENFNAAFPTSQVPDCGCWYDWVEKDGAGVYLAFVDSCHLGDHEYDKDQGEAGPFDKIARGRFTVRQSETLLEWHDKGLRGLLEDPRVKRELKLTLASSQRA